MPGWALRHLQDPRNPSHRPLGALACQPAFDPHALRQLAPPPNRVGTDMLSSCQTLPVSYNAKSMVRLE